MGEFKTIPKMSIDSYHIHTTMPKSLFPGIQKIAPILITLVSVYRSWSMIWKRIHYLTVDLSWILSLKVHDCRWSAVINFLNWMRAGEMWCWLIEFCWCNQFECRTGWTDERTDGRDVRTSREDSYKKQMVNHLPLHFHFST